VQNERHKSTPLGALLRTCTNLWAMMLLQRNITSKVAAATKARPTKSTFQVEIEPPKPAKKDRPQPRPTLYSQPVTSTRRRLEDDSVSPPPLRTAAAPPQKSTAERSKARPAARRVSPEKPQVQQDSDSSQHDDVPQATTSISTICVSAVASTSGYVAKTRTRRSPDDTTDTDSDTNEVPTAARKPVYVASEIREPLQLPTVRPNPLKKRSRSSSNIETTADSLPPTEPVRHSSKDEGKRTHNKLSPPHKPQLSSSPPPIVKSRARQNLSSSPPAREVYKPSVSKSAGKSRIAVEQPDPVISRSYVSQASKTFARADTTESSAPESDTYVGAAVTKHFHKQSDKRYRQVEDKSERQKEAKDAQTASPTVSTSRRDFSSSQPPMVASTNHKRVVQQSLREIEDDVDVRIARRPAVRRVEEDRHSSASPPKAIFNTSSKARKSTVTSVKVSQPASPPTSDSEPETVIQSKRSTASPQKASPFPRLTRPSSYNGGSDEEAARRTIPSPLMKSQVVPSSAGRSTSPRDQALKKSNLLPPAASAPVPAFTLHPRVPSSPAGLSVGHPRNSSSPSPAPPSPPASSRKHGVASPSMHAQRVSPLHIADRENNRAQSASDQYRKEASEDIPYRRRTEDADMAIDHQQSARVESEDIPVPAFREPSPAVSAQQSKDFFRCVVC
jgi:hypothetical protein